MKLIVYRVIKKHGKRTIILMTHLYFYWFDNLIAALLMKERKSMDRDKNDFQDPTRLRSTLSIHESIPCAG